MATAHPLSVTKGTQRGKLRPRTRDTAVTAGDLQPRPAGKRLSRAAVVPGRHSHSPPQGRYIHLQGLSKQSSSFCGIGKQDMTSGPSFQCSKSHFFLSIYGLTLAGPQQKGEGGSPVQSHLPWHSERCGRGALYLSLQSLFFFFKPSCLLAMHINTKAISLYFRVTLLIKCSFTELH